MTMREKIARAMWASQAQEIGSPVSWEEVHAVHQRSWLRAADAVLAAMREPTEEMWAAAWEASEDYFLGDDITKEGFRLGLQAMIDAAKEEK